MPTPESRAARPPLFMSVAAFALCVSSAFGASSALTGATDLAADLRDMRASGQPLLVLYSQAGCTWCEEARRYIVPMSSAPETRDSAVFRQVDIDSDARLTDFAGMVSSHRSFAQAGKVRLTPTVIIYGPDGKAIGEPIVGMRLPDFYGQYLLNAIESARIEIENRQPGETAPDLHGAH